MKRPEREVVRRTPDTEGQVESGSQAGASAIGETQAESRGESRGEAEEQAPLAVPPARESGSDAEDQEAERPEDENEFEFGILQGQGIQRAGCHSQPSSGVPGLSEEGWG